MTENKKRSNIMEHLNLKVIIEKTADGFSAYSKDYDGIYTAAENLEELKQNINEVIGHQVNYLKEQGKTKKASQLHESKVTYIYDLKQFFKFYAVINKSEFAKYAGISPAMLKQYTSSKPIYISEERIMKIQNGLHKLAKDLQNVQLA